MRRAPILGLVAMLAGCGGGLPVDIARLLPDERRADRTALAGGDVIVTAPPGYCIDPRTRRDDGDGGFAVVAACAAVNGTATDAARPLVATVTVGPRGATADLPTPPQLADLTGGRLVEGGTEDGLVLAHLDGGATAPMGADDGRHWRAAFLQAGHLVGLALYAPEGSALADAEGGDFLRGLADRIVRESPDGSG